ncbi:MAG: hypothetical protein EZS28_041758, partial [Streblomastix strix]
MVAEWLRRVTQDLMHV